MAAAIATAFRQYGAISWQQARFCGLTQADLRRLVRGGEWVRLHRQVYAVRSLQPTQASPERLHHAVMAAQLALGPHARAAGQTAARLWGMQGLRRWDGQEVHMAIPALGAQRHLPGIELHSWDVQEEETTEIGNGIRVTVPDCFVPGLMEAFIPGKDESHGSTEEVPR